MILVGGEALVDLVLSDGDEVGAHLGGGPFNCARTLGRLEQPVAYLGRISTDRFGLRLRAQLEANGVGLEAVVETEDPTTLALAELDADSAATVPLLPRRHLGGRADRRGRARGHSRTASR